MNLDKALASMGITGVVFDKDNTLTRPYVDEVEPSLAGALEDCRAAFGSGIVPPRRLSLNPLAGGHG